MKLVIKSPRISAACFLNYCVGSSVFVVFLMWVVMGCGDLCKCDLSGLSISIKFGTQHPWSNITTGSTVFRSCDRWTEADDYNRSQSRVS